MKSVWVVALLVLAGCTENPVAEDIANARERLGASDLAAAEIHLRNALKKQPESAEARLLAGQWSLAKGNPMAAEPDLRRALQFGADAQTVLPALAQAMLAQEKYGALIDEFSRKRLDLPAAEAAIRTAVAIAHARQERPGAAEEALTLALRASPDHAPALTLKARLKANQGDLAGAAQILDAVLARGAGDESAWTLKGDLLVQAKAAEAEIIDAYRKAATLGPNAVHPHTMLMSLLLRQGDLDAAQAQLEAMRAGLPRHPNTQYFEAWLALDRRDLARARTLTQYLLRGAPENPKFLQLAGRVELASGSYQQAQTLLEQVVLQAPDAADSRRLYAAALLGNGLADRALDTLRPLLRSDQADVETFALAARIQQVRGDEVGVREAFENARQRNPNHTLVRGAQALTVIAKGDVDAGLAQLSEVAAADRGVDTDIALFQNALRLKRFKVAARAVDQIAAKQPGSVLPHIMRGDLASVRGDPAAGRAAYSRGLEEHDDAQPLIDGLARLDIAENKLDAALERYRAQATRQPKNAAARLAAAELLALKGASPQEVTAQLAEAVKADAGFSKAHAALVRHQLKLGQTREARLAAQTAVASHPADADLLELLARTQLLDDDINQAEASYRRLTLLRPRSAQAFAALAEAQTMRGDLTGAADSVRQAIRLQPDWPPVQEAAFRLALREGRTDEGLRIARRLQSQPASRALGHRLEGDLEASQKRWPTAIAQFRKAMTDDMGGDTPIRLHVALLASGDAAAAQRFADERLAAKEPNPTFVQHLAEAALMRNDFTAAEAHFKRVLILNPNSASAMNNLAYLTLAQQKPGALAMAEKAVAMAPNNPLILDTLAKAHADQGQLERAVEVQTRAVALAPRNGGLRLALAKYHLRSGNMERARQELGALSQLGRSFSGHDEVAAMLKEANR
jgi:putative PEP-CTERM system TPR-repeat lipoprotein